MQSRKTLRRKFVRTVRDMMLVVLVGTAVLSILVMK